MTGCELVEALEDRCYRLEGALGTGYSKNADVSVQLDKLYAQLHDLYFQSLKYSQNLLELLNVFIVEDVGDTSTPDDIHIFTSCFDDIYSLYSKFDDLNNQYMEFSQTGENSFDQIPFKDANTQTQHIKELPGLVKNCNVMILRSMTILNRFIEWNIEVNGFFQFQRKRLLNLQKIVYRK
ncbi:hypothetical protein SKDZ_12G0120 [Saccharomyces kudriavzevii ZP591]|uniref:Uncharacterized protein n=3 Tax=Saccharomyces TaxID=4930 RepID=A0AA35J1P2_SACK1|nr:uncharacterized protein SKDI_12G0120 [Saccharomyces kudriavzevii IFO 1802]EHN01336.1 Ldb18p [Saccharomyces cerevisiae x Saccharomyces kudriavzevii VIN7]EJT44802.1 LDB18-like protein [Saccharomyces kudriavzevii IFO 1802]CAI4045571.1 hypothetical protein SKDI_12G0120 [Saccharomyces kudriavzevii IFO 1802]CAI4045593.1 hypothetical protein SKDZ_12G0120 [Saccharomyces kudriavzevii ZP591]